MNFNKGGRIKIVNKSKFGKRSELTEIYVLRIK